jgi:hypothetical protein
MGVALQLRRGTTAEVTSFTTGVEGELILDTTTKALYVIGAGGTKHIITGGSGGSGTGTGTGETEWSDMPVYDAVADTLTITNEDGSTTVIDLVPPLLVTPELNSIIADAIAAIPDASGLTLTDLNTLQTQLEAKIDLDNQVQDQTIAAVSAIQDANSASIAVLSASATATAEEIAASVTADLYAQIGTNASGLQSEQNVRALADLTIAQDVTNLQSAFDTNTATVNAQLTSLATEDTTTAQAVTTLNTSVGTINTNVANITSDLSAVSTEAATSTAALTALDSRVGSAESGITTLSQTVANIDSTALASTVSTLGTTVAGNTASISTTSQSLNGIEAKRSIVINAGGDVTGFEMLGGGGAGSQIKFNTDNFVISGSGAGDRNPFSVSGGNVSINGDLIATGTMSCAALNGGTANVTGGGFSLGGAGGSIGIHTGLAAFASDGSKFGMIATGGTHTGIGCATTSWAESALVAVGGADTNYTVWKTLTALGHKDMGFYSTYQDAYTEASRINTSMLSIPTHAGYFDGDVAVTGTLSYFTGSHNALITPSTATEGDIVVDVEVIAKGDVSDTLTKVATSSTPNQKGAVGIFNTTKDKSKESNFPAALHSTTLVESDSVLPEEVKEIKPEFQAVWDAHDLISINSLGEGQINVCGEGGNLEIGDLIVTSSIAGKGKKQGDDIIRSTTVAKVRENVTFSTYSEVKQVACIYLCG